MLIMVVEDDASIRDMLGEVLADAGHVVVDLPHGREALQSLEALAGQGALPDLILLDLAMPVMDGWGFLAERGRDARLAAIPVILLSAGIMMLQRDLPSLVEVAVKPIDIDQLLALVTAYQPPDSCM
jgi:CheY-like chemotaxis protein